MGAKPTRMNELTARTRLLVGTLSALVFVLISIASVHAYIGQNPYIVEMQGPSGAVQCDGEAKVTATVRDAESGVLVPGQAVHWDFKTRLASGDAVKPATTVTDENGQTSVIVTFGPVEGRRTVRAMIANWPTTTTVTCQGGVSATPSPSPSPTRSSTPSPTRSSTPTPTPSPTSPPTPPPTAGATNSSSATGSPSLPPSASPGQQPDPETPSPSLASPNGSAGPATAAPTQTIAASGEAAPATSPPSPSGSTQPSSAIAGETPVPALTGPSNPELPGLRIDFPTIALLGIVALEAGVGAAAFVLLRRR